MKHFSDHFLPSLPIARLGSIRTVTLEYGSATTVPAGQYPTDLAACHLTLFKTRQSNVRERFWLMLSYRQLTFDWIRTESIILGLLNGVMIVWIRLDTGRSFS